MMSLKPLLPRPTVADTARTPFICSNAFVMRCTVLDVTPIGVPAGYCTVTTASPHSVYGWNSPGMTVGPPNSGTNSRPIAPMTSANEPKNTSHGRCIARGSQLS